MAAHLGEAASKTSRDIWKSVNNNDEDDEEEDESIIRLKVEPSTIEGAGDGLFVANVWGVMKGQIILEEEAISIKRSDAKLILKDPIWSHANPIIQCNSNRFLDIRKLLLYKSNHCFSKSRCCNVYINKQGSSNILQMIALRDIDQDEELMWEYSPTWYPPE